MNKNADAKTPIYMLLDSGEENAVTATDLADTLGIPMRKVTLRIRAERLAGVPIASSGRGFFLPRDRTEAAAIARRLHHRAAAIHATANAIEQAVCDPPDQTKMQEA